MNSVRNTLLGIAMVFGMVAPAYPAQPPKTPPDLTVSNQVDRERTYNLGATGMRGWIYTRPADYLDSVQGRTTTASRQILVTHVGVGSPADGVVKVNDVILGVDGKAFSDDARKSLALAIQEAEKTEHGGMLTLLLWREGKTTSARLKLRVMGTYGDTAPYGCAKSKRIFDEACKVLEKEPLGTSLWGAINGLALLSSGREEYLPRVRELARKLAPPTLKLEGRGLGTWESGYRNVFLCEYYLLTGDQEVSHGIQELTLSLARGQGMYGTFGHGFAEPAVDGGLHGSIPPYGPVNAAGLVGNLAIVLGKKCGVRDREVDAAIERACRFFGYYVDKGTIPYGEHEPWPYHDNNGKSAMAAVLFALAGGHSAEAKYFAKMTTASYENREYGHTGQGFSYLWGALGANMGGPAAASAFFREASWHLDLVRRCDGSFTYDGGEQYGPGKTDDNTYYGKSAYYGLSPTATYVLTYSLPYKKLLITGREGNPADWLNKKDVAEALASGRFDVDRGKKNAEELIVALGDWSPVVRGWAAQELARRDESKSMSTRLIGLAQGADVHVSQGACEALGLMKDPQALPVLVGLLSHADRWVRFKAAEAIRKMGGQARPALAGIMTGVVQTAEPSEPIAWNDPIQLAQGQLAAALFEGEMSKAVRKADPNLLYPVIRVFSRNPDGMARSKLGDFFANKLTPEDVQALAPDLLSALAWPCPADTMFSNGIRMGAFKALTKYHYKEGIQAGIDFARTQGGHGSESRTGLIMKEIETYGAAARPAVPKLKELIVFFNEQCKRKEFPGGELNNRRVSAVEAAIKAIEAATTQPELRTIAPAGADRKK